MSDWQPIATAPKDGSAVLAYDGEECAVVRWGYHTWVKDQPASHCWVGEGVDYPPNRFTHWMPLPLPPKDQP